MNANCLKYSDEGYASKRTVRQGFSCGLARLLVIFDIDAVELAIDALDARNRHVDQFRGRTLLAGHLVRQVECIVFFEFYGQVAVLFCVHFISVLLIDSD